MNVIFVRFYKLVQLIASENFLLNFIKKISENPKGDMIHNWNIPIQLYIVIKMLYIIDY